MSLVQNPILPGFHPDPSAVRVGDTFYIANSTFEYYPGVKISSSKDLIQWKTEPYPLNEERLLNMMNQDASSGVWAPCLSFANGVYYLVYSNIRTFKLEGKEGIPFHDDYNFLITSASLDGPWSDPIYLTGSGFDASMFHDEDGRKWLLYAKWSWRKEPGSEGQHAAGFYGIAMQEYDQNQQRLVGEEYIIFKGTEKGLTEGPHLYKKEGYYYLLTAEGGTEYEHACTIARSEDIFGPYETRPGNPYLLTAAGNQEVGLQKSGHGALFTGIYDEWYLVHLCSRPIKKNDDFVYSREHSFSVLGRETAIQPIEWRDGWPYILGGSNAPLESFEVPYESSSGEKATKEFLYDFQDSHLSSDFLNLRIPMCSDYFTTSERKGYLRIYGRDSIVSRHKQSALFRRQQDFYCEVETCMEFEPNSYQQLAGLLYRYNEANQYYAYVSFDEKSQRKYLSLMCFDQGSFINATSAPLYFDYHQIYLKVSVEKSTASFLYSFDGILWSGLGDPVDALKISDEYCWPGFTGAMFGISAQDFTGKRKSADFKYFTYRNARAE